jgi:hypothetical protein
VLRSPGDDAALGKVAAQLRGKGDAALGVDAVAMGADHGVSGPTGGHGGQPGVEKLRVGFTTFHHFDPLRAED